MARRGLILALLVWLAAAAPLVAQSVTVLAGHAGPVHALAFDSAGRHLVTGSLDRTVRSWRLSSTRLEQTIIQADRVHALAVSVEGQVASAGLCGSIQLAALERPGGSLARYPADSRIGPGDPYDEKKAGGKTQRAAASLPEREAAEQLRRLRLDHGGCVFGLAFGPGELLASCGEEGMARVWNLGRGSLVHVLSPGSGPLYALAVSEDGQLLATAGVGRAIHLFDLATGRELRRLAGHGDAVLSLVFVPQSHRLFSASHDGTLRHWDADTGELLRCLDGHDGPIGQLSLDGSGTRLASAGPRGDVLVWDAAGGQVLFSHRFPVPICSAVLAPDGSRLAVGTVSGRCYLLDLPPHIR
jgi:WD40 repeat protein